MNEEELCEYYKQIAKIGRISVSEALLRILGAVSKMEDFPFSEAAEELPESYKENIEDKIDAKHKKKNKTFKNWEKNRFYQK